MLTVAVVCLTFNVYFDIFRAAFIRTVRLFEGCVYSKGAFIRRVRLLERRNYSKCAFIVKANKKV